MPGRVGLIGGLNICAALLLQGRVLSAGPQVLSCDLCCRSEEQANGGAVKKKKKKCCVDFRDCRDLLPRVERERNSSTNKSAASKELREATGCNKYMLMKLSLFHTDAL